MGTTLVAGALFFSPQILVAPGQEPTLLVAGEILICGIVLGVGRQGIDVLLLRIFIVATGSYAGTVAAELKVGHMTMCPTALVCVQSALSGALLVGIIGTVLIALVSIPVTIAWNRGIVSLRPEIRWPVPRKSWQWLLLSVVVAVIVFFSGLIFGAPWPP